MPATSSRHLKVAQVCNAFAVVCACGLIYGTVAIPPARAFLFGLLGEESLPELSTLVFQNFSLFISLAGGWAFIAVAVAWRFRSAPTPALLSAAMFIGMTAQAVLTTLALLLPFVSLVQTVGTAQ